MATPGCEGMNKKARPEIDEPRYLPHGKRVGLVGIVLGLLAAFLSLPWISSVIWPDHAISKNRAALATKLGPVRPLEGRLTGGFAHLPMGEPVVVPPGQAYDFKRPPSLLESQRRAIPAVARKIGREHKKNPTSQTLGDKALLMFLSQRWDLHQSAIALLEEAVAEAPSDANLLSDLAAAYLASTKPDPPGDFLAISAATRALSINPSHLEARFNLALALEQTFLLRQARLAWLDYLRLDPSSGWAEEARERLKALRKPSVRGEWILFWKKRLHAGQAAGFPWRVNQVAREDATEEILAEWALSHSQGRVADAQGYLARAKLIGAVLKRRNQDQTVAEAVEAIENAKTSSRLGLLATGHLAYRQGLRHYRAGEMALAQFDLENAVRLLRPTGSPISFWAEVLLAEIACYKADFSTASKIVDRVRQQVNLTRLRALDARLSWIEGLTYLHQAEIVSAKQAFSAARDAAITAREQEFKSVAATYLATTAEILDSGPWLFRYTAVRDLPKFSTPRHRINLLRHFAAVFRESHPQATLYLLNEGLGAAESSPDSSLQIEILLDRSSFRDLHGDEKGARLDLRNAQGMLPDISDPVLRPKLNALMKVTYCQVIQELNQQERVRALTGALQYFSTYIPELVPNVYRLRAAAYEKLSAAKAQESDLLAGIGHYEKLLSIPDPGHRLFLLDRKADDLFDDLIRMKLHEGNFQAALDAEEWSRARPLPTQNAQSMFGGWGGCNVRTFSPREFRHGLPKQMAVVEYKFSGERITAWVFRSTGVRRVRLPVSRTQIEHILPPLSFKDGGYYVNPRIATDELTRILLRPLAGLLPAEGELLFIQEPILDSVDFDALRHPISNRRLCGDYGVASISKHGGFSTHGRPEQAFAAARSLFTGASDRVSHASRPYFLTTATILRSLPPKTALIEYAFLGEELVMWVASQHKLRAVSFKVNRQQLTALIDRLLLSTDLHNGISDEALLEELFRQLIKPILHYLPANGNLVIVPDEALAKLPFAAFRNPASGKYLVEDYTVSISPSATFYLEALKNNPKPDHSQWTAFIVSNPTSPELPYPQHALEGARRESDLITQLFEGSEMVSGSSTNWVGVREGHQIVHFAGHWNPTYRTYDGTIQPDELPVAESVRLVVLSACRTAFDPLRDRYDGFGLPEPILAGGVPAVVATLWNVDDIATSHLLSSFYRHFRAGKDGAHALRAAQLEFLRDPDTALSSPSQWAGFQFLGFGGI